MKNSDVPKLTAADPALIERLEALYRRPGFMIRRCHQFAVSIFLGECAARRADNHPASGAHT